MASDVNDITIQYEEDGLVIVKEIDKEILSKGSWATLLFRYRQWDKSKKEYGSDSYAIRRYQKVHGESRKSMASICRNQNSIFPAISRQRRSLKLCRNG
jgi:hypothetical protein